jgi:hypothetical protein
MTRRVPSGPSKLEFLEVTKDLAKPMSRFRVFRAAPLLLIIFATCVSIEGQEGVYLDTTQIQIRQRVREPATGSGSSVSGWIQRRGAADRGAIS